jgi:hypothetical protein
VAARQRRRRADRDCVARSSSVRGSSAVRWPCSSVSSGWDVTVVEQYPPGHVRAASGGESRLIRFAHGDNAWYTGSARRALDLWRELERETGTELSSPPASRGSSRASTAGARRASGSSKSGGWRSSSSPRGRRPSLPELRRTGARVDPVRARSRSAPGARRDSGHGRARDRARSALRHGHGRTRRRCGARRRRPARGRQSRLGGRRLARRSLPRARRPARDEAGRLFLRRARGLAGAVDSRLGRLRQRRLRRRRPRRRGFKASPDREGPPFDPDAGERVPSEEKEREAREYLALRFPALAGAPLVGTRSCPYSLTEDTNFLITPAPRARARLALRRRLGPRLQARARARGVRGEAARRLRGARPGVRARSAVTRGRFARPLDRTLTR